MQEDVAWVQETLNGNKEAYAQLVRKYYARVYRTIYHVTFSQEDSKDLTQECFIRAYKQLGKYDQQRPFSAWLFTITIRLAIDEKRKKQRQPAFHPEEKAIFHHDPEQIYLQIEEQNQYLQAIQKLSPKEKLVLSLRFDQKLSYDQIAEIMNLKHTSVRNLLYSVRKKLKKWLTHTSKEVAACLASKKKH